MPKADQFYRVLKPTGTFVLNIKERAVNGERHTYVIELILEMRKRDWFWTEELHVAQEELPSREVAQPFPRQLGATYSVQQESRSSICTKMQSWYQLGTGLNTGLIESERHRQDKGRVARWEWLWQECLQLGSAVTWSMPNNVIHMATESSNKNHSAVFPVALPSWFI